MKARIAILLGFVFIALIVLAAVAAQAHAVVLPYGACWGYEWGKLAQNAQGIWYRCAWTGNGPTGFQWWRL